MVPCGTRGRISIGATYNNGMYELDADAEKMHRCISLRHPGQRKALANLSGGVAL